MRSFTYLLRLSLITCIVCARTPLKRSSSTRNPDCSPEISVEPEDTVDINYVFVMDHTFVEDNISKLKYLMKAMSCEITSTEPYKLSILHLHEKQNTMSKYVPSANFSDLLDAAVSKGNNNAKPETLCKRLEAPLANMKINASSFYRFVVPLDTNTEDCSLIDTFRAVFKKSENRNQIHADVIQFGKERPITLVPRITIDWSSIDVKVEKLSKSNNFRSVSTYGKLAEEITRWAHDTIDKRPENGLFDGWTDETVTLANLSTSRKDRSPKMSTVTAAPSLTPTTTVKTTGETTSNAPALTTRKPLQSIPIRPLTFNVVEDRTPEKDELQYKNETYQLEKMEDGKFRVNNPNFTINENDQVFMNDKTYSIETFTRNATQMEIVLKSDGNQTLTLELNAEQFNSNIEISSLHDILQYIFMLYLPTEDGDRMHVAGVDTANDSLRLGWKESLMALLIFLLLLLLLCCLCCYRRKKKTEYYITNPAMSPLISTQSSHNEKTASTGKVTDMTLANTQMEGTQPSQRSSQSTQLGSQSHQSHTDPYSPPLHFVADIRYDSLRVTPPVSMETFASDREPIKNAENLKPLRIGN